jgi:hypothetical protein
MSKAGADTPACKGLYSSMEIGYMQRNISLADPPTGARVPCN